MTETERRKNLLLKYSEMQISEVNFVVDLVKKNKPKKILEIGLAAGSCSALIFEELKADISVQMYGIDYNESYYKDKEKKSGWLIGEVYPKLQDRFHIFTGGLAACFMDDIGKDIDFCVIDTMHVLPGELLDFLMVLPYLKDGAICVLHDTNLQNLPIKNGSICVDKDLINNGLHFANEAYATNILMNVLSCEKFFPSEFLKDYAVPNIVALKITPDLKKYVKNVFWALALPWHYKLPDKDAIIISEYFNKHYSQELSKYFLKIRKIMHTKIDIGEVETHKLYEEKYGLEARVKLSREVIDQKEAEIKNKNQDLEQKNIDLKNLKQGLEHREQDLWQKNQELSSVNIKLSSTIAVLDSRNKELTDIYGSKGWKLISIIRRIIEKIFKRGSLRRKVAVVITKSLLKTMNVVIRFISLIKKIILVTKRDGFKKTTVRIYRYIFSGGKILVDAQKYANIDVLYKKWAGSINKRKPVIVFQVEAFDKGGLEEIVLMLSKGNKIREYFNTLIFVAGNDVGYMSELAEKQNIPVIALGNNAEYLKGLVQTFNIKICHLHYSLFGIEIYKNMGVKVVYTIHNNYIWMNQGDVKYRTEKYALVDKFVAVSSQVKDYFSKKFSIDPYMIKVVLNGIDLESLVLPEKVNRKEYNLSDKDFVFINVSSFGPNKFHSLMVVAFNKFVKKHPNAAMLFVGNVADNHYFKIISKEIKKYNLSDKIKIIDFVPKEKIFGLMYMSDCFMLPSLTEGLSVAMIEAMYCRLPLILSDVGGSYDAINKSDIGLVIKNPYNDMQALDSSVVNSKYIDDSNLNNLDDLYGAMDNIYLNYKKWEAKAVLGKEKVETVFNSSHMCEEYKDIFCGLELSPDAAQVLTPLEVQKMLDVVELAVVAPYPSSYRVREGWMSRIYSIDKIINQKKRLYIHYSSGHGNELKIMEHKEGVWEVCVSPDNIKHNNFLDIVFGRVGHVYVHTLHLAEYIMPWISTGKIIVDFHGITPEEEAMLGNTHLVKKYEAIERRVLREASACVMVTRAMERHYKEKYSEIFPKVIIIPIVESTIPVQKNLSVKSLAKTKVNVIYSGGSQSWQNVDAMLLLADKVKSFANVRILSHDWKIFSLKAKKMGISSNITFGFCSKKDLSKEYSKADFGLMLRDDTAVNRVACPTKIFEYMSYGIIPITRSESIGDFKEFDYAYISESDFINGITPVVSMRKIMAEKNYQVISFMNKLFVDGANELMTRLSTEIVSKNVKEFISLEHYRRNYLLRHIDVSTQKGLEIGAYRRPTIATSEGDIKFLDYYSTADLKNSASSTGEGVEDVVNVDYVVKDDHYDNYVKDKFDYIIANHVIEHVSNPIKWLQTLSNMLNDGGVAFIVAPDKKYNFDRYRSDTTLSHLITDYFSGINHIQPCDALDVALYYDMSYINQKNRIEDRLTKDFITKSMKEDHPGLHSHVFQSELFLDKILKPILYAHLIDFSLLDYVYSTQFGEFVLILRKGWKPIEFSGDEFYKIAEDTQ